MFLLSTEAAQRQISDVLRMEADYNWPVAHREGAPDLSGGEANLYTSIQQFNASSRNIKLVFINQFGFEPKYCGTNMPEDMEFMDIRRGSDVEFGLSIYEPFGIAQFEPLSFGGICVVSNVCGCVGFVNDVTGNVESVDNVIVADYTDLNHNGQADIEDLLQIDFSIRDQIEQAKSQQVADRICRQLPKSEAEIKVMLARGYEIAAKMSWETVVSDYLLKSLQKAMGSEQKTTAAGV